MLLYGAKHCCIITLSVDEIGVQDSSLRAGYSINIAHGDDKRRKKMTAAACGAAVWRPAVMSRGTQLPGDEVTLAEAG